MVNVITIYVSIQLINCSINESSRVYLGAPYVYLCLYTCMNGHKRYTVINDLFAQGNLPSNKLLLLSMGALINKYSAL